MRLKDSQIQGIVKAFEEVSHARDFSLNICALYLYGSRTKDNLKGGDIDLLLRVPSFLLKKAQELRIKFSLAMKRRIGEQKIDLLIIDKDPPQDPFHCIAVEQAILLKKW